MGLDIVELIMELEDEFELTIPNEVAEHLVTVGQTTDYLVRRLGERSCPAGTCGTARSFYALRRELTAKLGVARDDVRPDSSIGSLVAPKSRRGWRKIANAAGLRPEPNILFRSPFPPETMSVRELIARRSKVRFRFDGTVDEEAVFERVRDITADQTNVPVEQITHETRYVEDLGMG